MTLFWQKTSLKDRKTKRFITQRKTKHFDKIKPFRQLMICFCYFCPQKTFFPSWAWPIMTPFLCVLSPKKQFLRGFFRTAGFQHKLLILILVSPSIFHWVKESKMGVIFLWGTIWAKLGPMWKKQRNWYFNGFFSYIITLYIYKQKGTSDYRNTLVKIEDY